MLRSLYSLSLALGFDPRHFVRSVCDLPHYVRDAWVYWRSTRTATEFPMGRLIPCLGEGEKPAGGASGHYFHQDSLVARRIFLNSPDVHFDVGSRWDGFVAHVAAYRLIFVVDIRQQATHIANVEFVQADLMSELPTDMIACCDSVSSLHAIEHFGLGRYGDALALDGWLRGLENLLRMVKPSGKFYFSVPMGEQRIEFNAHRIFAAKTLFDFFEKNGCRIDQFSYVDDEGYLHEDVKVSDDAVAYNFGCHDGCAIFEMTTKAL